MAKRASGSELPSRDEFAALKAIAEGTARSTGDAYFLNLVRHLATAMGTRHAFVSEFFPPQRIRTLAFWSDGRIVDNIEYDLPNTPCERVIGGGLCHIPAGVEDLYPETEKGIQSYLGVPLKAADGTVLGHLCVLDEQPMPEEPMRLMTFELFASRAAAELDRIRIEASLRDSEGKLQDLFDEAPIAYVHEGLDTRFLRANRAALRILGVRKEDVSQTYGRTLVPDTPEAQQRLRQAFESLGRGTDTSGVVLELRRKDNGQPLWIQWWSKPDPSGTYTRTMFIDITERVLMEQEQARLQAQNTYLREEIQSIHNFEEIIGASAGLRAILDQVRRVAPTDATALILGETGTGKELIARALHSASKRADRPFIKINCAALPPGLIESELFGHERGAFSGAIQRRVGRFELAHSGTIFLDEVGEIPLDVQVKLLRVLQEREFERIGGNQTIRCDVRVIAATNRDLPKAIRDGQFRADLYYRLNVVPLQLPPLRERREDIPLLMKFFAQRYGPRVGRRVDQVDSETLERALRYAWPGNIRELENVIERALILGSGPALRVDPDVLPLDLSPPHIGLAIDHSPELAIAPVASAPMPPASAPSYPASASPPAPATPAPSASDLDAVQREHIQRVLDKCGWVIEGRHGAAATLNLKPATLRHRMRKLGIARPQGSAG